MADELDKLVGHEVVLDTAGPVVYMGRLVECNVGGFWLVDADLHNCSEGHATREQYISESARDGIHVNRRRIHVFRHAVISISVLGEVVTD
ncbi:MAG: hypothetical protein GXY44_10735 [Phycisphaerales bacterium]|nr:hypothetical protein [Phycisphaerales bacterium]